jgi:hypothetical protein
MIFQRASNGIIHQFRFYVDTNILFPNLPFSTDHGLNPQSSLVAKKWPLMFWAGSCD